MNCRTLEIARNWQLICRLKKSGSDRFPVEQMASSECDIECHLFAGDIPRGLNCALPTDEFCNEGELQEFTIPVKGLYDTLSHTILEPNSLGPGPVIDLNLGNGRFEPVLQNFCSAAKVCFGAQKDQHLS